MSKEKSTTLKALQEKLGGVLRLRDEKQKELTRADEIKQLEAEIRITKERELEEQKKLWSATLCQWALEARAILDQISELTGGSLEYVSQVPPLGGRIGDLRDRLFGLCERARDEVPTKWRQISSAHGIMLEKDIEITKQITPIFDVGNPIGKVDAPANFRRETEIIKQELMVGCIRSHVDRLLSEGWRIKPGFEFIQDDLDWDNSIREPIIPIPTALQTGTVVFQFTPRR